MKKLNLYKLLLLPLVGVILINSGCTDEETIELPPVQQLPAMFNMKGNLKISYDQVIPLSINIKDKSITKMELMFDDKTVKTWDNPSENIDFEINSAELGLGAHHLDLLMTTKSGESFVDNRLLRVLSNSEPEKWTVSILNTFEHDAQNFTQGLEFSNGQLYESTGQYGQSGIKKIELSTGKTQAKQDLDATKFGEGITILGDTIYQLTWKAGKCYLYNKNTLQPLLKEFEYSTEGWGLCNDGKQLIMSEGSEYLTFRDPSTFAILKTIQVYNHLGPIPNINELEYIDGFIYANVWMSNKVVVVDPESGKVIAEMDASELKRVGAGDGGVLNGIAHNSATGFTYMTGKNWAKLFQVSFTKPTV